MTMGQGLYGLPEPELPKKEIPAWRKKLRWPIRIVFWVLVFFSVCIFMLMRFGGANEDNREMLSRVMSDISGTDVRIGALNAASFYPLIGIDAERIAIYRPTDDGVQQIGSIDRANYATGFWSALRGRMDIRSLSLHGVRFYDGGITPLSLRIDRAVIDLDDPRRPALVVDGFYGDHILSARLGLDGSAASGGRAMRFVLAREMDIDLRVGPILVEGTVIDPRGRRTVLHLDRVVDTRTGRDVRADLTLAGTWTGAQLYGTVESGGSTLTLDLHMKKIDGHTAVEGTIGAPSLNPDDLFGDGGAADLPYRILALYTGINEADKFGDLDANVALSFPDGAGTLTIKNGVVERP